MTLLALLSATQVLAACKLSLSVSNVNVTWTQSLPTQQIAFTVNKKNADACDYAVTFSKGGASTYNRRMTLSSSELRYQLYKESALTNVLKDTPEATTTNDVVSGSFGAGANLSQSASYFLVIPYDLATQPTLKAPGQYSDTITLRVFDQALPAGGSDDSANVQVRATIDRLIQLSLVASGAGFDPNSTSRALSFGTLTDGASRSLDLRVLSNAGYQVSFSSQNDGVLRHATSGVTTTVPYTLTVGGVARNLAGSSTSPVVVASGGGQTSTEGVVNDVTVTIGSVANKMAGSYSDVITVTTATTE